MAPASTSTYINGVPWPGCDGHDNGYNHWTCNATVTPGGNPSALVLNNGTTLLLFRTYYKNATMCEKLGVVLRSKADGNGYPGCTVPTPGNKYVIQMPQFNPHPASIYDTFVGTE